MEAKIIDGKEFDLDFKFEEATVKLVASYEGKGVKSSLVNEVSLDYFLEKLAAAIPGTTDDVIIAAIKGFIKK